MYIYVYINIKTWLLYDYNVNEGFTAITSLHFMRFDVCQ